MKLIQIHPTDTVAVALEPVGKGERLSVGGSALTAGEDIPRGHKIALVPIRAGTQIFKYGYPIGTATVDIPRGGWVHTHNVGTGLTRQTETGYHHRVCPLPKVAPAAFQGFRRADGGVAIRNELWIIPTVGCVNGVAQRLARENQHLVGGSLEGIYHFPHPFGCSQLGDDHAQTRRLLAALVKHPNAGGVLVVGLGCENLTMEQMKEELGDWDDKRVKFLVCQDCDDENRAGSALLTQLADYAKTFSRTSIPAGELVVGMKCGGSDGLSGITANPVVGRFSDRLIALGGTTVLTEVPEMFGAEGILLSRCADEGVFQKAQGMISAFQNYFTAHGQTVYENPSPGNKAGGITTLEDKSCGCVQKGGSAQVTDVLQYGERVRRKGLNLLSGPGNDLVSTTALTAAGVHLILFTTGRGTPFGAPAPTLKISSSTALFTKKRGWMDFDAGTVAQGEDPDGASDRLLRYVLEVASGTRTKAEENGFREISIFKDGVVL
ncbi:MAG: altronate dehydratase family protein [Oscillospiraceae bacterium]